MGLMLSDGHIRNSNASRQVKKGKPYTGNSRLEFTFKSKAWTLFDVPFRALPFTMQERSSFLDWSIWVKREVLGAMATPSAPTPWPVVDPTQYWFATKCHPIFTAMESLWYSWGMSNKGVPKRFKHLPQVQTPTIG
jgi:hypothetical protein